MNQPLSSKTLNGSLVQGVLAGAILPWIVFWCYYIVVFKAEFTFPDFMEMAIEVKILSPAFSLCMLINLAAFFVALKSEKLLMARGLVGITVLYSIVLFLYKFLG